MWGSLGGRDAAEGLAVEFLETADLHGQEPHAVLCRLLCVSPGLGAGPTPTNPGSGGLRWDLGSVRGPRDEVA